MAYLRILRVARVRSSGRGRARGCKAENKTKSPRAARLALSADALGRPLGPPASPSTLASNSVHGRAGTPRARAGVARSAAVGSSALRRPTLTGPSARHARICAPPSARSSRRGTFR
eukprot:CAMPEP_0171229456 /NCGR_PEP_ID=MMETSP0790-20130122/38890_1 /TAXON_ID=2925 /ORGANISM="Alexandrium catenella, Strain OF101" /LENGTH=116 /DNA_ID=CAMNT_0011695637 /DNA_START=216 /DNA_END=562 /DNA_ORIENTATION=+